MVQSLSLSMLSGDKDSDVETLALAGSILTVTSYILDSASEASDLPSTDQTQQVELHLFICTYSSCDIISSKSLGDEIPQNS